VKPAPFAYARAKSVEHAIELLARPDGEARLLAGGQSLIATLNMRLSAPKLLVDLNGLSRLSGIAVKAGMVEIGALTRHVEAERSADIAQHAPLIALAMPHIGHVAIRNRGTFGGSIAFADPAAELPACLLALGGEIEVAGDKGRRTVKADDFFKGLFDTALGPREVLTAIRVPAATRDMRVGFGDVRLAYFGVGNTPVRAKRAETALTGGSLDDALKALTSDLDPSGDVQATAATKKHLAGVLLKRVARQLMEARP
jgi:carbon-monoxide dehydrogenase medium subunit